MTSLSLLPLLRQAQLLTHEKLTQTNPVCPPPAWRGGWTLVWSSSWIPAALTTSPSLPSRRMRSSGPTSSRTPSRPSGPARFSYPASSWRRCMHLLWIITSTGPYRSCAALLDIANPLKYLFEFSLVWLVWVRFGWYGLICFSWFWLCLVWSIF